MLHGHSNAANAFLKWIFHVVPTISPVYFYSELLLETTLIEESENQDVKTAFHKTCNLTSLFVLKNCSKQRTAMDWQVYIQVQGNEKLLLRLKKIQPLTREG